MGELLCPLRHVEVLNKMHSAMCFRERCAWWVASEGRCAVALLAAPLEIVTERQDEPEAVGNLAHHQV